MHPNPGRNILSRLEKLSISFGKAFWTPWKSHLCSFGKKFEGCDQIPGCSLHLLVCVYI